MDRSATAPPAQLTLHRLDAALAALRRDQAALNRHQAGLYRHLVAIGDLGGASAVTTEAAALADQAWAVTCARDLVAALIEGAGLDRLAAARRRSG